MTRLAAATHAALPLPIPNRRTLLGSLAGTVLATLPTVALDAAENRGGPALMRLADDLAQAEAEYGDAAGAEGDRLHELMHQLRRRIIETPAHSMADVRLKTRIVTKAFGVDDAEIEQEMREEIRDDSTVISLALMIVLDLSRLSVEAMQ